MADTGEGRGDAEDYPACKYQDSSTPDISQNPQCGFHQVRDDCRNAHDEPDLYIGKSEVSPQQRPCRFFRSSDQLIDKFHKEKGEWQSRNRKVAPTSVPEHPLLLRAGGPETSRGRAGAF